MLQVRPCPHPIWTASILMIRILRQARLRALRLSLLRVVSVEGLQSTSSRTCVTCFTALAPHSTSVLRSLCSLIDQCHTHSPSHRAVNPKGCSPPRTLFLTARVFPFRKTLARSDRAAVLRLHKPSAHKVQACGLASSRHDNIVYTILKAQRRLNNKEREGSINAFIHCSYFTHSHTLHTRVYFPSQPPNQPCVYSPFGRLNRSHLLLQLRYTYLGYFWRFNFTTNLALYLFTESSVMSERWGKYLDCSRMH